MSVTIKRGDLLEATEDIIAHQVNCHGVAGGLAADIFDKWSYAEHDYMQICWRVNPWALIGFAQLTGQQKDGHIICNLFGQYQPGADYNPEALEKALTKLATVAEIKGWSVAIPYHLSCGICGGDWNEVYQIIERTMQKVTCVIYQRECDE